MSSPFLNYEDSMQRKIRHIVLPSSARGGICRGSYVVVWNKPPSASLGKYLNPNSAPAWLTSALESSAKTIGWPNQQL
jgi:hypothetical protein